MAMKLTQEEFIEKAREVHGDKYDYSQVEYINSKTKVCIICPKHGEFWQTPQNHLAGYDCIKCSILQKRKKVFGIGIYDAEESDEVYDKASAYWRNMLKRCYYSKGHDLSYKDCSVCEEWMYYSNFKKWFDEHYVDGWHLDKDILRKGNKVYSPHTCCFVPLEINSLFTKKQNHRGQLPIGVSMVSNRNNLFQAQLSVGKKRLYIGSGSDVANVFNLYKASKEAYIKQVANKYRDQLEPRVYNAMYDYKVEITD